MGAPICGALLSSTARTRLSSQIRRCAGAALERTALSSSRCSARFAFGSASAVAPMLLSSREVAIRNARVPRTAGSLEVTMSGSVDDDSSSSRSMTSWVTSKSAGSIDASPATSEGITCRCPFHSEL